MDALTQLLGEPLHWNSTWGCRVAAPLGACPAASPPPDGRRPRPRPCRQCRGAPKPPDAGHLRTGQVVLSLPPQAAGHRIDGGSQLDSKPSFLLGRLGPRDGLTPSAGEPVSQMQMPQGMRRRLTSATVSARYRACNPAAVSAAVDDRGRACHGRPRFRRPNDKVPDLCRIEFTRREVLGASKSGVGGYPSDRADTFTCTSSGGFEPGWPQGVGRRSTADDATHSLTSRLHQKGHRSLDIVQLSL